MRPIHNIIDVTRISGVTIEASSTFIIGEDIYSATPITMCMDQVKSDVPLDRIVIQQLTGGLEVYYVVLRRMGKHGRQYFYPIYAIAGSPNHTLRLEWTYPKYGNDCFDVDILNHPVHAIFENYEAERLDVDGVEAWVSRFYHMMSRNSIRSILTHKDLSAIPAPVDTDLLDIALDILTGMVEEDISAFGSRRMAQYQRFYNRLSEIETYGTLAINSFTMDSAMAGAIVSKFKPLVNELHKNAPERSVIVRYEDQISTLLELIAKHFPLRFKVTFTVEMEDSVGYQHWDFTELEADIASDQMLNVTKQLYGNKRFTPSDITFTWNKDLPVDGPQDVDILAVRYGMVVLSLMAFSPFKSTFSHGYRITLERSEPTSVIITINGTSKVYDLAIHRLFGLDNRLLLLLGQLL